MKVCLKIPFCPQYLDMHCTCTPVMHCSWRSARKEAALQEAWHVVLLQTTSSLCLCPFFVELRRARFFVCTACWERHFVRKPVSRQGSSTPQQLSSAMHTSHITQVAFPGRSPYAFCHACSCLPLCTDAWHITHHPGRIPRTFNICTLPRLYMPLCTTATILHYLHARNGTVVAA